MLTEDLGRKSSVFRPPKLSLVSTFTRWLFAASFVRFFSLTPPEPFAEGVGMRGPMRQGPLFSSAPSSDQNRAPKIQPIPVAFQNRTYEASLDFNSSIGALIRHWRSDSFIFVIVSALPTPRQGFRHPPLGRRETMRQIRWYSSERATTAVPPLR